MQACERRLYDRWRDWFVQAAGPFWRTAGWSPAVGLAVEQLHLDGCIDATTRLRVRTQVRQVYVYLHAAQLGLDPEALTFATRHLASLADRAHRPDGRPGWVHALGPDGTVVDDRRDLYDHAFVLLMLAHAVRATGDPAHVALLERALADLEILFAAPHGGYAETATGNLPRRQNPHMHLFEACLALAELTRAPSHLARAGELFGLFRTRFVDEAAGVVREFFAADWALLPDGGSDLVEPGHLMEWVWLLRRYERLTGRPVEALAERLFARGEALGLHPQSQGFLVDVTDLTGAPRLDGRRLWVQTEYLKALLVQARATGSPALAARAEAVSDALFATYLARVPNGTWFDRFTIDGRRATAHVPSSTLYHLFGVIAELHTAVTTAKD